MNSQTVVMCVVALLLGMLLAHMLKDVCGCKTVEGNYDVSKLTLECGNRQWKTLYGADKYEKNCTELTPCHSLDDCKPGKYCDSDGKCKF